ncbi:hypothetical protein AB3S75_023035 [Citrus x aurantiifolia]
MKKNQNQNPNFSLKLTRLALADLHKIANGRCPSPSARPAHTANSPFVDSFRPILVIDLPFATAFHRIPIVADLHNILGSGPEVVIRWAGWNVRGVSCGRACSVGSRGMSYRLSWDGIGGFCGRFGFTHMGFEFGILGG